MSSRQMYEQFNNFFKFFCVKDNLTVGYQCQCSTMYPLYDLSAIFPLSCKCEWCTSVISPVRITLVAFKEKSRITGDHSTLQQCAYNSTNATEEKNLKKKKKSWFCQMRRIFFDQSSPVHPISEFRGVSISVTQ